MKSPYYYLGAGLIAGSQTLQLGGVGRIPLGSSRVEGEGQRLAYDCGSSQSDIIRRGPGECAIRNNGKTAAIESFRSIESGDS